MLRDGRRLRPGQILRELSRQRSGFALMDSNCRFFDSAAPEMTDLTNIIPLVQAAKVVDQVVTEAWPVT
jgi:hypothetical protein